MNAFWPQTTHEFPEILDALQKIAETATELRIPFLLIGAMARDMLLEHVHDMSKERRTMDVDIGVMVGSWAEFSEFSEAMTARGFERNPSVAHRFCSDKGVVIDVVPFGGLADANGFISWPPDDNPMMRVTGFDDALRHSLRVETGPGQVVNVVSLPGLAMLKLLAWNDRRYVSAKDAQDLALLLRLYGDFARDRLFDSEFELMERHGFDIEMAGAELLGQDIGATVSEATAPHLFSILCGKNEGEMLNEQLVRDISRYLPGREYLNAETILKCVLSGIELCRRK
jgi:predicted nucleotidyltransferase